MPGTGDGTRQQVHVQIADGDFGLWMRTETLCTAQQCFDARLQFGQRVGFDDIVIAAGAQAFDPVIDLAARRENQGRHMLAVVA